MFRLPTGKSAAVELVPLPMLKAAAAMPSAARMVTVPAESRNVMEPKSREPVPMLTALALMTLAPVPSLSELTCPALPL